MEKSNGAKNKKQTNKKTVQQSMLEKTRNFYASRSHLFF